MENLFEENQQLLDSEVFPELQVAPVAYIVGDLIVGVVCTVVGTTVSNCTG